MGWTDNDNAPRFERNIANGITLCRVTQAEERAIDDAKSGAKVDSWSLTLALQEEAKDTSGERLEPGFFKDIVLVFYPNGHEYARLGADNEDRACDLIRATLGIPKNNDLKRAFREKGGMAALVNKDVKVQWSSRKGRQNVDAFIAATV